MTVSRAAQNRWNISWLIPDFRPFRISSSVNDSPENIYREVLRRSQLRLPKHPHDIFQRYLPLRKVFRIQQDHYPWNGMLSLWQHLQLLQKHRFHYGQLINYNVLSEFLLQLFKDFKTIGMLFINFAYKEKFRKFERCCLIPGFSVPNKRRIYLTETRWSWYSVVQTETYVTAKSKRMKRG